MLHRTLTFSAAMILVLIAAFFFRAPALSLRPMHGDEAVNAFKFRQLWQRGQYRYDPHEYHGPSLPYLTLPAVWLGGADDFAGTSEATYRAVTVVFGVVLVALTGLLVVGIGRGAALTAAALTAVSPMMGFYSRYYIHEMLLAAFTIAAILCGLRYARSRRVGWAVACGACLGLMHATKETCIIAWAAMAAGLLGAWAMSPGPPGRGGRRWSIKDCGPPGHVAAAIGAATIVSMLLFSAFFTHPRGVIDSVLTFAAYLDRGVGGQGSDASHVHPWHWHLWRMVFHRPAAGPWFSEALIVGLAFVGFFAALLAPSASQAEGRGEGESSDRGAPSSRFPGVLRFFTFYTLALVAAYSAISYKTPWSFVTAAHAMIVLAGVGAEALVRLTPTRCGKWIVGLLLAAAAAQLAWQSYRLNFLLHTDRRNPYVYAHPVPAMRRIAERAEQVAAVHPNGFSMPVAVIHPGNYWPLPFELRRFTQIGYAPQAPSRIDTPMVIADAALQEQVAQALAGDYQAEYFGLRPDAMLVMFIRRDLWDQVMARLRDR